MFNGIGVSKGIAIGQAYVLYREQPEILEYTIDENRIKDEIKRFHRARKMAQHQLNEIKLKITNEVPQDITLFIDTNLLMLNDPLLNEGTVKNITQDACNAEWALQAQCGRIVKVFDDMDDEYLKTRKDDIIHVVQRIQRCLSSDIDTNSNNIENEDHLKGRIIIADDLTPALDILKWASEHALTSGVMAEQVNPYTNAPLSVSPLTWSHATFVLSTIEYVAKMAALKG